MESKTPDNPMSFQSGSTRTTQIGFTNPNNQKCLGHRGVPGNDHLQKSYRMECLICGENYGANGSDVFERRCPKCQQGKAGIRY
jgi:hypothetical protein